MQRKAFQITLLKNKINLMKKILSIVLGVILLLGNLNCLKNVEPCTPRSPQNEQAAMLAYASTKGINGAFHSSGIYYEIVSSGSGVTPVLTSTITAHYFGRLISNDTQFDASTPGNPIVLKLNNFIMGWQIGLQLIQKGGIIRMIIPSSLAYGCTGTGPIPADAVLYFEVTLQDVQ